MSANAIREEIDGYVNNLMQLKERISAYRSLLTRDQLLQAESETTLIAIDGTLQKLNVSDDNTISLDFIVRLSDDVNNVVTTSNRLLSKLQNRGYH